VSRFRNTADYVTSVLRRCGEPTNGNSSFIDEALEYLNKVNHIVTAGGNIFSVEVDDTWQWARARQPMVMQLQAPYTTGSISLTNGSESGVFSTAPAFSVEGWHFQVRQNSLSPQGDREIYKIVSHTAGSPNFEFDTGYLGGTGAGLNFNCFKIDYEIVPEYIYVDATNNKIDFLETTASPLAATLTHGSYTVSAYATHVAARLSAAGASTYTGAYNTTTRKFSITSNLTGGGGLFSLLGATGTNLGSSALPTLGFDDLDYVTGATQNSTYILGGISRMVEPFRVFKTWNSTIDAVDNLKMSDEYPLSDTRMGIPTKFTRLNEDKDGRIWVRFNKYPQNATKIEVEYVPVPRDLQNNAASIPLLPRKYSDVLEYGAASLLLLDKEDTKASVYEGLAGRQLKAMQANNRSELYKAGRNFGELVPREDLSYDRRVKLRYGYTTEDN
jgi:hypothetical protein